MQLLFRYYLKFFSKYVIISDTPYPKFSRKAVFAMSGEYERSDNSVNENNYTEFTVKRSPGALRIIAKIALVILYIGVVVGMWFILWWLGAISLLVAVALCYFTWPYTNIEYEYTTSSGDWRFVRIYGGKRRVPVLEVKIKDMQLIAPYTPETAKEYSRAKVYDFRKNRRQTEDIYCAVFENEAGKNLILFQCTEKALSIFKYYNKENTVDGETFKY